MAEENELQLNKCFLKIAKALEKMVVNEKGEIVSWVEESLASLWETADYLQLEEVKRAIEKMFDGKPRLMKGEYRYTFCYSEDED